MPIAINGSGTITGISAGGLPDASITADELATGAVTQVKLASGVGVTGPAFSAYQNTGQSFTSGVFTKIQFQTEDFDTANCFDNSTNYRFTPNVAGYYQINGIFLPGAATSNVGTLAIYKNGSVYSYGAQNIMSGNYMSSVVAVLLYLNGSTDYVELYGYQASGGTTTSYASGRVTSQFTGVMVRGA
jgi:hypothetical protein